MYTTLSSLANDLSNLGSKHRLKSPPMMSMWEFWSGSEWRRLMKNLTLPELGAYMLASMTVELYRWPKTIMKRPFESITESKGVKNVLNVVKLSSSLLGDSGLWHSKWPILDDHSFNMLCADILYIRQVKEYNKHSEEIFKWLELTAFWLWVPEKTTTTLPIS